ncbi:MAG: DUF4900 domain-containing protein [Ignavibacteriales bacterium]|nr:DUF4900 domain-containing protein [Ignavibacteriales bacterium]
MGGKAILFLVIGFSLIFMIAGKNFNDMGLATYDNVSNYYVQAKAHYIANSGVNLVVSRLFQDATIGDQTFTWNFDGGTISAVLTTTDAVRNIKQLLSTGTYVTASLTVTNTIKIILQPSLFSKFAYFSDAEAPSGTTIYWTTKDTVWGPFHTNDNLNVQNNPVFFGKVTIAKNVVKNPSSSQPKFLGGFQKGVQIAIPPTGVSSVATSATTGGAVISGHSLVYFEFRGDSVRYKFSSSGAYTYKLASTFAPNGAINFVNAEVRLKGTVKGRYTISTSGSSGNQGSVFLDDNIVYNTNPRTNPSSTDMLGIVAEQDVMVTNNTANNTNGITINASIYCQNGSFGAEDYDSRPSAGFIDLLGGITQKIRGAVGTISGSTINHGFSKRYRYDDRLLTSYPPAYPGCGSFEIISWFE